MVHIVEEITLGAFTAVPLTRKFRKLPIPHNVRGWQEITGLDSAVTFALQNQGYVGSQGFFADYLSFAHFHMWNRKETGFDWISFLPPGDGSRSEFHTGEDPTERTFITPRELYVPVEFAARVLALAQRGIKGMKLVGSDTWKGVLFDGREVDYHGRGVFYEDL